MKTAKLLLPIAFGMLFAASAGANERLTLNMDKSKINEKGTIINVNEAIHSQYPHLQGEELSIQGIEVKAKSENGQATLVIKRGGEVVAEERIYGSSDQFKSASEDSFDSVEIKLGAEELAEELDIEIIGDKAVLKEVDLIVGHQYHPPYRRYRPPYRRYVPPYRRYQPPYRPAPRYRTQYLECNSWAESYSECRVYGRIVDVDVVRRHSSDRCVEGRSYGWFRNTLWVDDGCRATFAVYTSRYY